jgi:hypothetical protein
MAMQLCHVKRRMAHNALHLIGWHVNKHADGGDKRGKPPYDFSRLVWGDMARAFPVKDKAKRIDPQIRCSEGIIHISDTAYLYLNHNPSSLCRGITENL